MGAKVVGKRATKSAKKQYPARRVPAILETLQEQWGHAVCELDHDSAYQLTVATILSAQSTDKLVNKVTPALFERFPTAAALAGADLGEVETLVRSTGFFRNKAKNIVKMAQQVVAEFDGEIPRTMEEMTSLAGVARKTANVVLGTSFGIPAGIAVDTHVKRLSSRLGLSEQTNPVKIERDLMELIPKESWIDFSQQLIWHGRRVCDAKKPACDTCALSPICPSTGV
ncbi:MAG: endonuclease III [Myxococcales bacterium]|nr:endonuclease III [Myxococcales bacterium]